MRAAIGLFKKVIMPAIYMASIGCLFFDNHEAWARHIAEQESKEVNRFLISAGAVKQSSPGSTLILVSEQSLTSPTNREEIVIQLVDEAGVPLRGVVVDILKQTSSSHVDFLLRNKHVNEKGQLYIPKDILPLPEGAEIAINSPDDYYFHYVRVEDISVYNGIAKIAVPKTGIIVSSIKKYPKEINHPVVVEAYRKKEDGAYESFRGIGIFLQVGYAFEVVGLPAGIYKIQIKDDYGSTSYYFEKEGIQVVNGRRTNLGEIELRLQ